LKNSAAKGHYRRLSYGKRPFLEKEGTRTKRKLRLRKYSREKEDADDGRRGRFFVGGEKRGTRGGEEGDLVSRKAQTALRGGGCMRA